MRIRHGDLAYSRVDGVLLQVRGVVCARDDERRLKSTVTITCILRARPVRWVSLRSCTVLVYSTGLRM